jgi:hypothetical protein
MVTIGGFILMTHIGDQEFIIIIILIRYIITMVIEWQEIMVIEVESIVEPKQLQLDLKENITLKHLQLDHNQQELKHLQLDHKVVEDHRQEEEVKNKSHHNRWVFIFLYIYYYEKDYKINGVRFKTNN